MKFEIMKFSWSCLEFKMKFEIMKFSWSCSEFKMKEIVTTEKRRFHFTNHNELLSKGIEFFHKLKFSQNLCNLVMYISLVFQT